jgi:hypothetical protein
LPFTYYLPDTPDTISVVFASSAGGGSMVGHVGSTLYIDNINLSYTSGINEPPNLSLKVQCYPVPSNSIVNFILERTIINGSIRIFNVLGNEIKSLAITKKEFTIPVEDLSKGKYYYQVVEKSSTLKTGYFLVN